MVMIINAKTRWVQEFGKERGISELETTKEQKATAIYNTI